MGGTNQNLFEENADLNLPDGDWSSWSPDEWVTNCPFCFEENKFTFNVVKNVGKCWVCEKVISGRERFIKLYSGDFLTKVDYQVKEHKINTKETSFLTNAWDNRTSKLFLLSRNVDEYTSRKYNIQYACKDNTLIIPTRPISEDLPESYLWRKLPDGKWFHKKGTQAKYYGFGWEKFKNSKKNVLICEGIFDLISSRMEPYGLAVLGSHLNDVWFLWFKKHVNKLVLWFDKDLAGETATNKISEKCMYFGIPFSVVRSAKDPKDYDRRLPKDREFLDYLKEEITREQISFSRRYTFRR